MKGLYLTFHSEDSKQKGHGIWKKILSQIEAINRSGIEIQNYNISTPNRYRTKVFSLFNPFYFSKKIDKDFYNYDFYYIRYPYCSFAFLNLLKKMKKYGKGKIIVEIPTYPYDGEITSYFFDIVIDKLLRNNLKKYIDAFTTYSIDKNIYGVPAIPIMNGIDCSKISVSNKTIKNNDNSIHLIAIAQFADWHGYDRLINGLNIYYKNIHDKNVYLHLVGSGSELKYYKELIEKYNLSEYIIIHGLLYGEELSELINNSSIGICSLGNHRKNIFLTSELKSREYLASGLPIVSSVKIDVIPENYKYCFYVPADESQIDIQSIINFYNNLFLNNDLSRMIKELRKFAEENCDMNVTIKPVVEYIKNIS